MLPFFGYGSCAVQTTTRYTTGTTRTRQSIGMKMSPLQIPTTSAEIMDRKVKKPLMEKLRRKRINESLDALKDFVLMFDSQNRQNAVRKHLEKADILERTVECVQQMRTGGNHHEVQLAYERGRRESYDEGFNAATRAVFEYLALAMPPNSAPASQHFQLGLITHLRMSKESHSWMPPSPSSSTSSEQSSPPPPSSTQSSPAGKKRPWQPWN